MCPKHASIVSLCFNKFWSTKLSLYQLNFLLIEMPLQIVNEYIVLFGTTECIMDQLWCIVLLNSIACSHSIVSVSSNRKTIWFQVQKPLYKQTSLTWLMHFSPFCINHWRPQQLATSFYLHCLMLYCQGRRVNKD